MCGQWGEKGQGESEEEKGGFRGQAGTGTRFTRFKDKNTVLYWLSGTWGEGEKHLAVQGHTSGNSTWRCVTNRNCLLKSRYR